MQKTKIKNSIIIFFVIGLILILSCSLPNGSHGSSGGSSVNSTATNPPKKWSVLIHFAVDNNIDYSMEAQAKIVTNYLTTLENIKKSDTNNSLDIYVMMDCYYKSSKFKDGYYKLSGGTFNNDLVIQKSEINSGNVDETKAFIDWVVGNNPASERYMYSVFNHGSGFDDKSSQGTFSISSIDTIEKGIGFDDSSKDCLTVKELGETTAYLKNKIGKKIDLFYPYACLMGGVELAYEVKDNSSYILFSEELFPADYWSYEGLASIVQNSSISSVDLGKSFCDSAYNYFNIKNRNFTLSIIDLSQINDLVLKLNSYASSAVSDLTAMNNQSAYNSAADSSFTVNEDNYYYLDLGDYLNKITWSVDISSTVKSKAADLLVSLNSAVLYKRNYGYPNAYGVTIFHNIYFSNYYYSITLYKTILSFGTINSWSDYLTKMDQLNPSSVKPDQYEYDNEPLRSGIISLNEKQRHTIQLNNGTSFDTDIMKVTLEQGKTYKIETYEVPGQISVFDTYLSLYDPNLYLATANDDGGSVNYSKIIYTCTKTGVYYIVAEPFDNTYYGFYDIDVQEITASNSLNIEMSNTNIQRKSNKARDTQ